MIDCSRRNNPKEDVLENILEKGENSAVIYPFSKMFSIKGKNLSNWKHLNCHFSNTTQSPKNPLVRSYLRVQNWQGRVIFLTQSSSRTSDNKSDFIFLNSQDGFWTISLLLLKKKIPSRDPNFNDMQPRFMLANQRIE